MGLPLRLYVAISNNRDACSNACGSHSAEAVVVAAGSMPGHYCNNHPENIPAPVPGNHNY